MSARRPAVVAVLAAAAVAVLCLSASAAAGGHRAVRTFDAAAVEPGGEVVVTVRARDFGPFGRVSEVLPDGWTYSGSSLPEAAVTVEDGTVRFLLLNLEPSSTFSFTYTVTAPDTEGVFELWGIIEDSERASRAVIGHREVVVVDAFYVAPVAYLHAAGVLDRTLCADGFCPSEPIDRKTVAVWVVRLLDTRDPQRVTESRFDDVDPTRFHARFIERLADLGVTTGCGDGSRFCPDDTVTRAQMAVLLSRAYDLPDGPDPGFSDVPEGVWYAPEVTKLVTSGITLGCGDGSGFCPDRDTTRGQMATFLHRAETQQVQE